MSSDKDCSTTEVHLTDWGGVERVSDKKRNVSARCLKELNVKQFNLRKKLIDVLHEACNDGLWIDLIQEELKLLSSEEFIVCDGFDCDGKPI